MIESIIAIILLVAIFFAVLMFLTDSFVNIILCTLGIFGLTGILFLIIGADYLGFMFLIIYAGAIVILFICCFMLMSFKSSKNSKTERDILDLLNLILYVAFMFTYICVLNSNAYLFLQYFEEYARILFFYYLHIMDEVSSFSILAKIGKILFSEAWFETLYLGSIILLAIVFIIYLFKQ